MSAIWVISFGERFEKTTSVRIGAASGSILLTTGGSVSRGNRTVATLSRTSCVAASISRSSTKVMVQLPLPWLELQRSSSMPLMVLTAASIGRGDRRLDLFGAGTRQAGPDVDRRGIGPRHQVEAELAVRDTIRAR